MFGFNKVRRTREPNINMYRQASTTATNTQKTTHALQHQTEKNTPRHQIKSTNSSLKIWREKKRNNKKKTFVTRLWAGSRVVAHVHSRQLVWHSWEARLHLARNIIIFQILVKNMKNEQNSYGAKKPLRRYVIDAWTFIMASENICERKTY